MKVFILAGEASGDRLGAALMAGLRHLTNVEFIGVGGPLMETEGLQSLFPMDELSVMGIIEVLPKYRHLKRRIRETAEAALGSDADVMITIDSPDFSLRVAALVKASSDMRTVHYVAPSVWAWRAGRAAKMAKVIDHVLALLPFEPPYMEAAGMACDFVGHPVVSEPQATKAEIEDFRARHDLGDAPVMLVLPGSRRGEVGRLGPIFGKALGPVLERHPNLRLVVPTTAHVAPVLRDVVVDWPASPLILDPSQMESDAYKAEKACAFGTATGALAASGTVSLELAASATPMVIAYDVSWVSRQIIAMMLKIDTLTLVNLVSETRAIPECNGKHCNPPEIAAALIKMLEAPGAQLDAMALTMERLGRGGEAPGLRAARAVLDGIGRG
ncbi:lipid-A-disaccharide synthase [Roseovarius nanhaiticus]|uniref:Lipid-A-disaccharide synthase n=1 Tax=Roseovarius nanhaiticus TaxID=573024 RepID=A0A1N7HHY3_9RHOB|nr:lipid-A-disaccharide synthase [Roseovarius nanhaiticus]SEK93102.1 lipid-A-disaccharide synthase [Roseovarius nanhaiticus]SIS24494.1 lipid-A-disaccharide synthase [Roseovarius nanhaiticus]